MLEYKEITELTGEKGISEAQAQVMRQKFGVNQLTPPVRDPIWKQYLRNFDDPIIKILLVGRGCFDDCQYFSGVRTIRYLGDCSSRSFSYWYCVYK